MSDKEPSRFTSQNQTTNQRLSTHTVGLVALSDFRKRRAEVLEQQEREARDAASGTSTPPDRSHTGTPDVAGSGSGNAPGVNGSAAASTTGAVAATASVRPAKKLKKKPQGKKLLSFDDDDDEGGDEASESGGPPLAAKIKPKLQHDTDSDATEPETKTKSKFKANASVGVVPKSVTKAALRKQASEREALRREFVSIQEAVKATEVAIPFIFYDGANTPGGTVRVKKGDFVWVFLDKSRKVGAERGVGEKANALRAWARVGVDDLMLVRGTIIVPHHYDFHYFVMNKSLGPGGGRLFNYSAEAPIKPSPAAQPAPVSSDAPPLATTASRAASSSTNLPDIDTLEGAADDPTLTKVVDRRWYDRNKHIYPASMWQEFDPEKDYATEVRKDTGGNTLFAR